MSGIFYIDSIVSHRIQPNGEAVYYVKWRDYDSSYNTWEPKESFVSMQIIDEYYSKLEKIERENARQREKEKEIRRHEVVAKEKVLTADDIQANELQPKEVLNIRHIESNEKRLVALIRFTTADEEQIRFVPAAWANEHCPELVIKFYENRLFWRNNANGELNKCTYKDSAIAN